MSTSHGKSRLWAGRLEKLDLDASAHMWHSEYMPTVRNELLALHASVCKGLADPKRLLIINALRDDEMAVGEICGALELPQANVSQHLAVLRDKGLVRTRRDGQYVYYSLSSPKITEAMDLLREVMADQLVVSSTAG